MKENKTMRFFFVLILTYFTLHQWSCKNKSQFEGGYSYRTEFTDDRMKDTLEIKSDTILQDSFSINSTIQIGPVIKSN